jgi:hypothetical protein
MPRGANIKDSEGNSKNKGKKRSLQRHKAQAQAYGWIWIIQEPQRRWIDPVPPNLDLTAPNLQRVASKHAYTS